jgi:predicted O-methyltransferase YrrM
MRNLIKPIADLTPSKVWDLISTPSQIPAKISSPPTLSVTNLLRTLLKTATPEQIEAYRMEFLGNHAFFTQINAKMLEKRHRRVRDSYEEAAYVLTRFFQPDVVVETGVFDGQSSAAFLQAMHDNQKGRLISIDLPAVEEIAWSTHRMLESTLPPQCQPGWVIPDCLRDRHTLLLGDSKALLPQVLEEQKQIDFFLHDSLHTLEHQLFEYNAAWPYIRVGGLLLSDDIHWNAAFHQFCRKVKQPYYRCASLGICCKDS